MLTILFGLGVTLVLLAVHGKALPGMFVWSPWQRFCTTSLGTFLIPLYPALPISIFLAVIIFVMTRFFAEPFIQEVLRAPFYV